MHYKLFGILSGRHELADNFEGGRSFGRNLENQDSGDRFFKMRHLLFNMPLFDLKSSNSIFEKCFWIKKLNYKRKLINKFHKLNKFESKL